MSDDDISTGQITGFSGSFGSVIATIFIDNKPIMCENTTTVRALDAAFGDVIQRDHSINVDAFVGRTIVYSVDTLGLLSWFKPLDEEDITPSYANKCESCEKSLDEDETYFGETQTYYEWKPLCETCYYEADADATVVRSIGEQQIITSTRNETEGDFWVSWHSTDPWRGYYEVHSDSYALVNTAELLAWHESEKMLADFDGRIKELFEEYSIDYARVFARSSNVFYSNYDLFVRKDQILLASLLVEKAKHEVNYDDPKWYRNIIFDEDSLSKLAQLFPEKKLETDSDAMKLATTYGNKMLDEIQRRIKNGN